MHNSGVSAISNPHHKLAHFSIQKRHMKVNRSPSDTIASGLSVRSEVTSLPVGFVCVMFFLTSFFMDLVNMLVVLELFYIGFLLSCLERVQLDVER